MLTSRRETRGKRFNVRATASQDSLIRTVARIRNVNVTDFILESACKQAEQELADQTQFPLPPAKWNEFLRRLDRPPQAKPGLRRLFKEKTLLDEDCLEEERPAHNKASTLSTRKAGR